MKGTFQQNLLTQHKEVFLQAQTQTQTQTQTQVQVQVQTQTPLLPGVLLSPSGTAGTRDYSANHAPVIADVNSRAGNLLMLLLTRISMRAPFRWSPLFTWICSTHTATTRLTPVTCHTHTHARTHTTHNSPSDPGVSGCKSSKAEFVLNLFESV